MDGGGRGWGWVEMEMKMWVWGWWDFGKKRRRRRRAEVAERPFLWWVGLDWTELEWIGRACVEGGKERGVWGWERRKRW